jgi:hypothetical protein
MAMNFFLHGRYLIERPANQMLLMAASALDLTMITLIVLFWQGQSGLDNQFFVFYYPIILALSFVFPRRITVICTALALVAYTVVCIVADPAAITFTASLKTLLQRIITIAAMGGLGTYYWRIQRNRRRAALGSPAS